ncbi:MAG: serine/threonine-protein kinase [Myxococcota bacterium]|nr:serine/threonine-protein kinase [Myxococcota bacterium]
MEQSEEGQRRRHDGAPHGRRKSFTEAETEELLPSTDQWAVLSQERSQDDDLDQSLSEELPLQLGDYALLELAGEGSLGRVYQAQDSRGRVFAVKRLRHRFLRDLAVYRDFLILGRSLQSVSHPALLSVREVCDSADGPWWVMDWLRGRPLSEHLDRGLHWSGRQIARALRPVCEALSLAHARGLVHGDLKPDHLFLKEQIALRGHEAPRPELLLFDFGIPVTRHHQGSLGYMSPEQLLGRPLSPASDVYSLGVILYQLMTRELPHSIDGGVHRWAERVLNEPVSPPSSRLRPWPYGPTLDSLMLNLLSRNPKERCSLEGLIQLLSKLEELPHPEQLSDDSEESTYDGWASQTYDLIAASEDFGSETETFVADRSTALSAPQQTGTPRPVQSARLPSAQRGTVPSFDRLKIQRATSLDVRGEWLLFILLALCAGLLWWSLSN